MVRESATKWCPLAHYPDDRANVVVLDGDYRICVYASSRGHITKFSTNPPRLAGFSVVPINSGYYSPNGENPGMRLQRNPNPGSTDVVPDCIWHDLAERLGVKDGG